MSCCNHCLGADETFNDRMARRERKRYRKKGPIRPTGTLLKLIKKQNPEGKTLLDIGGGVGAISFELFKTGIKKSTQVDASNAYLAASRKEAQQQNLSERMEHIFGDFTELATDIEPADIVTLDRVVCCYPDMEKLLNNAAGKSWYFFGLTYPKYLLIIKIGLWFSNLWFKLRGNDFRVYLYHPEAIEQHIQNLGFERIDSDDTFLWQAALYERSKAG